jgi:uncharacterized protein YoxC
MTLPLASVAVWALRQAAAFPDTIVTRQISEPRSWFEVVSGVASIVIALALVALTVGLLPAAWNFRKSYKKVNELLDRIYGDVNPIMRHASSLADNLNYVSTAVRQDVARLQSTVAAANARLDEATRLTERRVRDFNALLEVVQGEAEATFVATAATVRGVREGAAAAFRDDDPAPGDRDDDYYYEEHAPARAPRAAARTTSEEADDERFRQAATGEGAVQDERPRVRRARDRAREAGE